MSHPNEFLDLRGTNLLGPRTPLALDQHGAARSVTRRDIDSKVTSSANSLDFGHPEHP
jgi:hypothetical protein